MFASKVNEQSLALFTKLSLFLFSNQEGKIIGLYISKFRKVKKRI